MFLDPQNWRGDQIWIVIEIWNHLKLIVLFYLRNDTQSHIAQNQKQKV